MNHAYRYSILIILLLMCWPTTTGIAPEAINTVALVLYEHIKNNRRPLIPFLQAAVYKKISPDALMHQVKLVCQQNNDWHSYQRAVLLEYFWHKQTRSWLTSRGWKLVYLSGLCASAGAGALGAIGALIVMTNAQIRHEIERYAQLFK